MLNDDNRPVDLENPPTDLEDVNAPLILEPDRTQETEEEIQLDGIPSVQKPGYGNWIWAEKQCARRSGLTVSEAMAIQAAYRVYQKDGDMKEFYDHVEFVRNMAFLPRGGVLRSFVPFLRTHRNYLEIWLERMYTIETIRKLSELFAEDEGQPASQEMSKQETQNHTSHELKT
jgi:hypothetical protein